MSSEGCQQCSGIDACRRSTEDTGDDDDTNNSIITLRLNVFHGGITDWLSPHIPTFVNQTAHLYNLNVTIEIVSFDSEARMGVWLDKYVFNSTEYDGYVVPAHYLPTLTENDQLEDLTDFVVNDMHDDWGDILPFVRRWNAIYNNQIRGIPLTQDVALMLYHKVLFEKYNRTVPRTWDEYTQEAEFFNGLLEGPGGSPIYGSCKRRGLGCGNSNDVFSIMSPYAQANGPEEGVLIDFANKTALLGEPFKQSLKHLDDQIKYGPPDEFTMTDEGITHCAVLFFLQRKCALFYGITNGALLNQPYYMYKDFLGVAALPGSSKILDRSTGKLKECTIESCPHSIYEEGIGLVNYAPAWGVTNWVGAVHAGKGELRKKLSKEFFALVGRDSLNDVIQNTTENKKIPNPHRRSHLVLDDWLAKGYDEEFAESYITAYESTESLNVAKYPPVDGSLDMIVALENVVFQYVNSTRGNGNEALQSGTEAALKTTFEGIIDSKGRDVIFRQYEKYLDVYKEPSTDQYLNNDLQVYGLFLSGAVLLTSLGIVAWMRKYRNEYVVIHSQPQVLKVALCGSVLMGAAIVPRSLDDKWLSIENCSAMCVLYPWVYFVGLGTMLSALFSKIERIILIHEKPNEGLSLHVSFNELKKSFIFAVVPNVLILLVWTIFRPNYWERSKLDDTDDEFASAHPDTFGRCVGNDANYTIIYFVLLLYNFGISFAQCLRLYRCTHNQKVSLDSLEDKWIVSAIMATFEFWLIGLPVLLLMADNYYYDYFVEVSLFALTALSSLAFLFAPKYFYLRDKLRNRGPFAEGMSSEKGYKIRSDDPNKFLRAEEMTDGDEGLLFRTLSSGYEGVGESGHNDELRKRLIVLEEENRNMKHVVGELEEREIEAIPPSMFSQVTT
mmetsp:Transcript_29136/g.45280  ORF Transcript_29136/g.45280 Transcript_29136/m.45280 type:complete len:895 (+) Transcript_29136:167-2851(+)